MSKNKSEYQISPVKSKKRPRTKGMKPKLDQDGVQTGSYTKEKSRKEAEFEEMLVSKFYPKTSETNFFEMFNK